MIVRVGSTSAMKLRAARKAFAKFFRRVTLAGVDVSSGVAPQPLSFGEVVKGARARARGAFRDCDYSVGIEAGVFRVASVSARPFQITMACVFDGTREALGSGPFFELPEAFLKKIVSSDRGSVSLLTKGKVTREQVTVDAVVMALAPFVAPEHY